MVRDAPSALLTMRPIKADHWREGGTYGLIARRPRSTTFFGVP
jgi:hypothetical protein